MGNIGITVFGCERDEAEAFCALSPRFGISPSIVGAAPSEANAPAAARNRCVSVGHKSEVGAPVLLALKNAGVRYLSTRSIGCNHIDTAAAARMGIAVGNVAYSPDSVADYTLMLALMALRNAKATVCGVERRDFRLAPVRGKALRDMTVGVVGCGRIGEAVIERLQGFGCRVLACSRSARRANAPTPTPAVEQLPLTELLKASDIVTLHVPLTAETRHLISAPQLAAMKPGAILINTGRGALVDTAALISALESGRLGGVALDVLEGEEGIFYFDCRNRPIENRFLARLQQMPNVLLTPHTAYYTEQALRETVEKTLANCLSFETTGNLP
ncbi:MAG: NAD(P)-binding domain-containing protein [Coriobacteriales bacterium]|jgi:D-specific alpha-keto acid dehydrogenase|nr:NAD(P)-binding domain-containing protein [Coriobacteriales bacterium]